MRKVSEADRIFYFEKNFVTLDGLWMLEIEKEIGWDAALTIDTTVWIRLLKIIIRRLKKYLNITTNSLLDIVEILTFRWSVEGWKYETNQISKTEVEIKVTECPYKAMMDRNTKRHDKIPLVCKNMCHPLYKTVIEDFNPKITLKRSTSMGLGDDFCNFSLKLKEIN